MRNTAFILVVVTSLSCWSQTSENPLVRNTALLDEIIQRSIDSGRVDSVMAMYVQLDFEIALYADAYPSLSWLTNMKVAYLNGNDALETGDSYMEQELNAIIIEGYNDTIAVSTGLLFVNMKTGDLGITPNRGGLLAKYKVRGGSIVESPR